MPVLDRMLGTTTKVQLLRAAYVLNRPAGRRELQVEGDVKSNSAAGAALGTLVETEILHKVRAGGAHIYTLNEESPLFGPLSALYEAEANDS